MAYEGKNASISVLVLVCAHMHIYVRAYVCTFTHMYMERVNAMCVLVKLEGGVWVQSGSEHVAGQYFH